MGQIRNDKLLNDIAIQVKRIRESKGLTQEEVYNDTGIHVGRIETAKSNVTVSTLDALCKYYDLQLHQLLKSIEG